MDPDEVDVVIATAAYYILLRKIKRKRRKTYWVHNVFRARDEEGEFHTLFRRLKDDPNFFMRYFRVGFHKFQYLLDLLPNSKKNTKWRKCISNEERLALTLRYLAAGDLQISLSFSYRISPAAVNDIIMSTCKYLWQVLAPIVMPIPTKEDWLKIAQDFDNTWHFPNCLGALDGKHVVIQAPNNSGSLFFNYKGTFSIVLMALVDANYRFIMVDVGGYGKASDGGLFGRSVMGAKFEAQELDIPEPRPLEEHGEPLPFVVVGDEAFPLKSYLQRPYPKNTSKLLRSHAIYNYRLSRARRVVENAFGILVQRFRILYGRLQVAPKNADIIVLACIALHNLLRNEVVHEQWPEEIPETTALEPLANFGIHASQTAIYVRNKFRRFFCGVGKVAWQEAVICRGRKN